MCEYADCSKVPLRVLYPGVAAHNVSARVSNVDIAPTLANIAGATVGLTEDGRSFLPMILGQPVPAGWRTTVLQHWTGGDNVGKTGHGVAIPAFWAVRGPVSGHLYVYVEISTGEKELYDETVDPWDLTNIAGNPNYATVQATLAARLARLVKQATSGKGKPFYYTGPAPKHLQIAPDD